MKAFAISHKGKRKINEDVILITKIDSETHLYLIADGMGGYENGEVGAKITIESIHTFLSYNKITTEENLQKAVNKANLAIRQEQNRTGVKLGATLGGIIVSKNIATCFWVGDVKILHFSKDKLLFESKSHNLIEELSKASSNPEKITSRYAHIVTRSIQGETEKSKISYEQLQLNNNDTIILCSDGMHSIIDTQTLLYTIKKGISTFTQEVNNRLLKESTDNASFIAISEF